MIDPRHLPFNELPPQVHIEQVVADGKTYDVSNGLHLPARVHDLTFDYTTLSLAVPEKARFRVRLEPQDKDWRELGYSRRAHYTNLPPSNYRLSVIASNNSGVWNEQGAVLDFAIAPAFYQTNWFRTLCVAAFVALFWALHRLLVQRLRRQERKLRDVIETMPSFAWTALPDGSVDFVNRNWQEYTGLSTEKSVGSGWEAAVHPEDLESHREKRRGAMAAGRERFENEVRFRSAADGEYRWFLVRAVPLRDAKGTIIRWYGNSTDIEDRKRAEQLQADLAHLSRVTTMGELTVSLAHEIKQPIAAAVANAHACLQSLKREQPDLELACEAADGMVKAGMRASDIIDRLRSLYSKSAPQRELVDVNEIVREMVVLLLGEANRYAVSMRTELAVNLPKITADGVQLQQVLMNLMLNGIEAMKETGGVVTVKSQLGRDGRLLISVGDTGVGLPAEKMDQIFNAFFTTKPQGSGMGLAISRSIVESHGGRVWATANDGRGATFHLALLTGAEEVKVATTSPASVSYGTPDGDRD
ncbi:ATP-binding protein [Edaphobacter aggregans]|uniref:ATP-binding protein n=1 Tax=Edaphobacter aggregans TaxID=570835 RepID=UPI00068B91BD|nr:ATP-binding protein [Edaphobacter aggregans]